MNLGPSANPALGLSANELIEIVNDNNEVLEPKLRFEMRRDKLIHRATYAFIRTSSNYFYVQKRSAIKDYCPGFFDPTPGGVVGAGESYEETNVREIEEEMGITGAPCEHLFTFYYEDQRIRCFGDAWDVVYDGPIKMQEEEVESVHMMSMQEVLQGGDFTPDSLHACREYIKMKGMPEAVGPRPEPVITK
ncbi:NUDIX hydrolase domain-like protein [Ochromonadaceae sp. CCMP2298]|nr:NUDIX hydrolase domain-like protein [Ochromonadaceae sp. CCMP2298]